MGKLTCPSKAGSFVWSSSLPPGSCPAPVLPARCQCWPAGCSSTLRVLWVSFVKCPLQAPPSPSPVLCVPFTAQLRPSASEVGSCPQQSLQHTLDLVSWSCICSWFHRRTEPQNHGGDPQWLCLVGRETGHIVAVTNPSSSDNFGEAAEYSCYEQGLRGQRFWLESKSTLKTSVMLDK